MLSPSTTCQPATQTIHAIAAITKALRIRGPTHPKAARSRTANTKAASSRGIPSRMHPLPQASEKSPAAASR